MLGFQDFTSTNSYGYSGFYSDPVTTLMTTASLSDLSSPYRYGTIAGATPASNANSANTDLAVVDSLLAEAWGIFQGGGTTVAAPIRRVPSPNTATAGNVGVGHQTGDPQVDSLLNQSDRLIADNKTWLASRPTDPLTGMPAPAGATVAAPIGRDPSPNTATAGNVAVGHKTGDPLVDSLLNQSDRLIADNKTWLASRPTDPLTGMFVNSGSTFDAQVKSAIDDAKALAAGGGGDLLNLPAGSSSVLPLIESIKKDVLIINNPNTTDADRHQINRKHQIAGQRDGNLAMVGANTNSTNKSNQRLNESKFESMGTTFNHGYIPGPDGYSVAYQRGNNVSSV